VRALLVPLVIGMTFVAGAVALKRGRAAGAGAALGLVLEVVGATVLFFAANVLVGAAVVLAARALTPFYPTLYEITDITLLIFSFGEALAITAWRQVR